MRKWVIILFLICFVLIACIQINTKKQHRFKLFHFNLLTESEIPKIDHIVIVIEENHAKQQIMGNYSAPYINSLMTQGANLINYHAIEHPSQPNYLDLFSGSNQGITDDDLPKSKLSTDNLASELNEKKLTFAGYSEDLPSIGFNGEYNKDYARRHNPWVNFTNVSKKANQPFEKFPTNFSKLPTVSFIIPNLQNDMHDGTIKQGDQWLKKQIDDYVKWAKKNNSLLIVTWDEDDFSHNNKIPTVFVGLMVKKGQFNENLNHFNLLHTIEDIYGLKHAGTNISVKTIKDIWK
ncbi:alkaline phosphatase family protein [Gottfriedia acidiceleris]|uniref:alkaline phosphatase family protein n=1 Tax=Gottfriedia acidiceleris TaxID=371036 RepID=UPI002FFE7784